MNFKAAFNLTQVFAKGIIENKLEGGTIVNISSIVRNYVSTPIKHYLLTTYYPVIGITINVYLILTNNNSGNGVM